MSKEKNPGPDNGAGVEPPEFEELTSETLWNIAMGDEPCDDPTVRLQARRFSALMMRQQGTPYRDIAAMLKCSLSTAFKYVKSEIEKRVDEAADTVRQLHLDRLNMMLAGVMDRATEGDSFAIDSALKVMGKIEALMGIEPPKKVEHTFGDGARDEARDRLAAAIAAANAEGSDRDDPGEPPATRH